MFVNPTVVAVFTTLAGTADCTVAHYCGWKSPACRIPQSHISKEVPVKWCILVYFSSCGIRNTFHTTPCQATEEKSLRCISGWWRRDWNFLVHVPTHHRLAFRPARKLHASTKGMNFLAAVYLWLLSFSNPCPGNENLATESRRSRPFG